MKVNCNYKVKHSKVFYENTKIVLAASNSPPENPVVLQSIQGEAGGFQQFNLFSLSTNTNTNLLQDKEVQLSSNFKCRQKYYKMVLAANPSVLQSTKGDAGGFQQFNLFSYKS